MFRSMILVDWLGQKSTRLKNKVEKKKNKVEERKKTRELKLND